MMKKIVLSCKRATELVEKQHATQLSFLERNQLNFHLKICKHCKEYKEQSEVIESLINKLYTLSNIKEGDSEEIEKLKAKISNLLKE